MGAHWGRIAEAIQAKDPFLRGHSDEVSEYVAAVAARTEIDGKRREQLVVGSLVHDVGRIGISERVLHKPAKLTPQELAIIQLHPRSGYLHETASAEAERARLASRSSPARAALASADVPTR